MSHAVGSADAFDRVDISGVEDATTQKDDRSNSELTQNSPHSKPTLQGGTKSVMMVNPGFEYVFKT